MSDIILGAIPIEDISVGMSASYSQTITDYDIKTFSGMSGDHNPIHVDQNYAAESRYGKCIAHGLMTASFFSGLFGTKLPGQGCVYMSQNLAFKRPVYIGDTVTATIEVTKVDIDKRYVSFDTICKVKNKIVTTGDAQIYIPQVK
jgi:3-hydroxybutyryl-CoA dehydratase